MKWTPFAILAGIVMEWIDAILARHSVTVRQWELIPEFRVFQYGRREIDRGQWGWFFILKLPSYNWQTDLYSDRPCWQQMYVMWTSEWGWRIGYAPVRGQ